MTLTARPIISAPDRDPLAGASLVAAKIGVDLRAATLAHQALEAALESGSTFTINAALLQLRRGAQSAQVLAYKLHQDVTERMRRNPQIRS